MYAMQYEIALPADYDMGIIRERVTRRGSAMDDFPGLGVKAFCIRERGKHGSAVNQYAPFYLWAAISGMSHFLGGPGFTQLCADFGRPQVHHWTGVAHAEGDGVHEKAVYATRQTELIAPEVDLSGVVEEALKKMSERARRPDVQRVAFAIDPLVWQTVYFTLWTGSVPAGQGDVYEVLHVSAPNAEMLNTNPQPQAGTV